MAIVIIRTPRSKYGSAPPLSRRVRRSTNVKAHVTALLAKTPLIMMMMLVNVTVVPECERKAEVNPEEFVNPRTSSHLYVWFDPE